MPDILQTVGERRNLSFNESARHCHLAVDGRVQTVGIFISRRIVEIAVHSAAAGGVKSDTARGDDQIAADLDCIENALKPSRLFSSRGLERQPSRATTRPIV